MTPFTWLNVCVMTLRHTHIYSPRGLASKSYHSTLNAGQNKKLNILMLVKISYDVSKLVMMRGKVVK